MRNKFRLQASPSKDMGLFLRDMSCWDTMIATVSCILVWNMIVAGTDALEYQT